MTPDAQATSSAAPARALFRSRFAKSLLWSGPVVGLFVSAGVLTVAAAQGVIPGTSLKGKVQKAFPNTRVTSITCGKISNLCEVTAGPNVFYVTKDGRYAMVGSLLDLKERLDLTDRRIKELAAVDTVSNRLAGTAAPNAPQPPPQASAQTPATLSVTLPTTNAIVHNPGGALKLVAFTDLNCGYCKMMVEALRSAPDIELTEYPMELLKPESADKAKLALCGEDRARSAMALYSGGEVRVTGDCKAAIAAVQANTQFARAHGITGTPTLVRTDGVTNSGFMPVEQLRTWIKAAKA